jgi:hypothetical protein
MIGKSRSGIAFLFSATLLTGCTSVWMNPDKPATALPFDQQHCQQEAMQHFPPVIVNRLQPSKHTPSKTSCKNNDKGGTDCITHPGEYTPPYYSQHDTNDKGRDNAMRACMNARGWQREKVTCTGTCLWEASGLPWVFGLD